MKAASGKGDGKARLNMGDMRKATVPMFDVLGASGGTVSLGNKQRGKPDDELLNELRGMRGMRTLREMRDNDATIGSQMQMTMNLIRRVPWENKPGPSGSDRAEEEARFYDTVIGDMWQTWSEFNSDVLSFCTFGFAPCEITFKRRLGKVFTLFGGIDRIKTSQYTDGRVGIGDLSLRRQDTIAEWFFDQHGMVIGCLQRVQGQKDRVIPRQKICLFRTESNGNNPEGRSLIRNAYRAWYFLKRLEEIEAVGLERELTGLPVMKMPLAYLDPNSRDTRKRGIYDLCKTLIQNIRRNEHEGVLFPSKIDPVTGKESGFELELLTTHGPGRTGQTNEVINRKKHEIASVLGGAFQLLGSQGASGSRATSEDHSSLYEAGLAALLDIMEETFHREVTVPLFEMNGVPPEDVPRRTHGEVTREDVGKWIERMAKAADSGLIIVDDEIENDARRRMKVKERMTERPEELDVGVQPDPGAEDNGPPVPPTGVQKVLAFVPPPAVVQAAKDALEASQGRKGGLAGAALVRARTLAKGEPVTEGVVKRLSVAFDVQQPDRRSAEWKRRGASWQQWHGMGGDAGREWVAQALGKAA